MNKIVFLIIATIFGGVVIGGSIQNWSVNVKQALNNANINPTSEQPVGEPLISLSANPDPIVRCVYEYNKPLYLSRSVCDKSIECEVAGNYYVFADIAVCNNFQQRYTELVLNNELYKLQLVQFYINRVNQSNSYNNLRFGDIQSKLNDQSSSLDLKIEQYKKDLRNITQGTKDQSSGDLQNIQNQANETLDRLNREKDMKDFNQNYDSYQTCVSGVNSKYNTNSPITGAALTQYYNELSGCKSLLK